MPAMLQNQSPTAPHPPCDAIVDSRCSENEQSQTPVKYPGYGYFPFADAIPRPGDVEGLNGRAAPSSPRRPRARSGAPGPAPVRRRARPARAVNIR